MPFVENLVIGGESADIPGHPDSITRRRPDGTTETLQWKKLPWIVSICENGHSFPTRIPGDSLIEWPVNWTRRCPKCSSTNWRVDTNFDYVATIVKQNDVDPDAERLLTYIQTAARFASVGDGQSADEILQVEAKPLLPTINRVKRKFGWTAVAALLFSVLTSCNADIDAKITVKSVTSWGEFHAEYITPNSRLSQEEQSRATPRQQQRLDQRKAKKQVDIVKKKFPPSPDTKKK